MNETTEQTKIIIKKKMIIRTKIKILPFNGDLRSKIIPPWKITQNNYLKRKKKINPKYSVFAQK